MPPQPRWVSFFVRHLNENVGRYDGHLLNDTPNATAAANFSIISLFWLSPVARRTHASTPAVP